MTDCTHARKRISQEEKVHATKRPTFGQSLTASVGELQLHTNFILVDHGIEVSEAHCRKSMLLHITTVSAAIRQISSEFLIYFSGTMTRRTGRLRQSTFLPETSPDVDRF